MKMQIGYLTGNDNIYRNNLDKMNLKYIVSAIYVLGDKIKTKSNKFYVGSAKITNDDIHATPISKDITFSICVVYGCDCGFPKIKTDRFC